MQQKGSKYDREIKEKAVALISSGLSITKTAKQLNVPKSTVADWWHTQDDADEDIVAARREARRASIMRCNKIIDKGLRVLEQRITDAGTEAKDVREGLRVLKKAAKDGVIGLTPEELKGLQEMVRDYCGVGLRELSGTVKDIAGQQLALEQQLMDAPDAQPELSVRLTLVDPAAEAAEGDADDA